MNKRKVDVVVMSDLHLGTYGCQAKEIVNYLKSIQPQILVLNKADRLENGGREQDAEMLLHRMLGETARQGETEAVIVSPTWA